MRTQRRLGRRHAEQENAASLHAPAVPLKNKIAKIGPEGRFEVIARQVRFRSRLVCEHVVSLMNAGWVETPIAAEESLSG